MPDTAFVRVDGCQTFLIEGRNDHYWVHVADDGASCTCPATKQCWHIREVLAHLDDPLVQLAGIAADRKVLDARERTAVLAGREQGLSWDKLGYANGRGAGELFRRRYGHEPRPVKWEAACDSYQSS